MLEVKSNLSIRLNNIHSSWIQSLPNGDLLDELRKTPRVEKAVMRNVCQYLGIVDIKKTDLNNRGLSFIHRYQPAELQTLVMRAGALQFSREIKQTITKKDVAKIRESLGKDLHDFILHNKATSQYPEYGETFKSDNFIREVINAGYHSFHVALKNTPNNFIFKLPKHWHEAFLSCAKKRCFFTVDEAFHKDLIKNIISIS